MRTQLSFQWLKLNPGHYNLRVLFLSLSYCDTQYSGLYCVLNVCGHIFVIECASFHDRKHRKEGNIMDFKGLHHFKVPFYRYHFKMV